MSAIAVAMAVAWEDIFIGIWVPFFGMKVWIQEMGSVEMGTM